MPDGGFVMLAIGAVATASLGATGWVAHRLGKDVDTLWAAVDELRRAGAQTRLEAATAARDYVTKTDIEKMEQRFERRLEESENRLLSAIRDRHRGVAEHD